MQVFLFNQKMFSVINKKEEITDETCFITDIEREKIQETLDSNGYFWRIDQFTVGCSGKQPTRNHKWDSEKNEWYVCPELLKQEIALELNEVWDKLKEIRTQKNFAGVQVDGMWFNTDLSSQTQYQNLAQMQTLGIFPENEIWHTMDGKEVVMTIDLVKKILGAIYEQTKQNFENSQRLFELAKTLDKPKTQDLTDGWTIEYRHE